MDPRLGPRRRSARLLALRGGPDLISALPDDLLLLILARLPCVSAAARTGVLSRRWRGLWARLRQIVFRDVPFHSLEAVLGRFPHAPPAVSVIDIAFPLQDYGVPKQRRRFLEEHRADAASINSLLRAAARLEPEEFLIQLGSQLIVDLPCFRRAVSIMLNLPTVLLRVPDGAEFPALERLSLSYCTVDIDRFLSCCPRLRKLRLASVSFSNGDLTVNSASLQELVLECHGGWIQRISIVAPVLKQLAMSFSAWDVNVMFGRWRLQKLRMQTAEQRSLLQIHAYATSSIFHGEVDTFAQEIEKYMIADFSTLEIYLITVGHVFGAIMSLLLGMNRISSATQRLKVVIHRSAVKEECPFGCSCEPSNWRSQTISLSALKEVEINGFEGDDHEIDFLKLIFKCAPMLKKMTVKLSHEASSSNDGCTNIYNIFKACSSVEFYVFLSSGLMLDNQSCPST